MFKDILLKMSNTENQTQQNGIYITWKELAHRKNVSASKFLLKHVDS